MPTQLLYLEDDPNVRQSVTKLLSCRGIVVDAYGASEDAAHYLATTGADIAVLDIRLPGEFGDAFAKKLKAHAPAMHLIFLTAETKVGHLKELFPDCSVLPKPIEIDVLIALVCSLADCAHDPAICPHKCRHRRTHPSRPK